MRRTVGDVMTRRVVVVSETAPFKEVVRTMGEHRVSAVPVMDSNGELVGIVSEADLLLKEELGAQGGEGRVLERRRTRVDRGKAAALSARDMMTSPVVSTRPDATLSEAARLMHSKGIKRLPVVSGTGKVVGIVSRQDLLRVFLREDEAIREEIERDVILRTLWIDPSTIRVTVRKGVVTLEGLMERQSLASLLVRLASEVDGVVSVESKLTAEFDDTVLLRASVYEPWAIVPATPHKSEEWTPRRDVRRA